MIDINNKHILVCFTFVHVKDRCHDSFVYIANIVDIFVIFNAVIIHKALLVFFLKENVIFSDVQFVQDAAFLNDFATLVSRMLCQSSNIHVHIIEALISKCSQLEWLFLILPGTVSTYFEQATWIACWCKYPGVENHWSSL